MDGKKYDSKLDTAQIAKLIRADIKAAIADKTLPEFKTSVRTRRFAGGSAIDIEIMGVPEGFAYFEACEPLHPTHNPFKLTAAALAALDLLKSFHAAYNFNNNDSMSDYYHVNYYGHVELDYNVRAKLLAVNLKAA